MMYSTISFFFFSSRRRHTRYWRDWSSDVCSSDLDPDDPPTSSPSSRARRRAVRNESRSRSEERRVGKECRSRWSPYHYKKKQSSPFPTRIWLPPFADPVGLRVPPIMARQVNAIGTRIATELDAKGMPGAVSQLDTYDAWYPGYIDYMPMYQNINAWWTETQGGNCATPRTSTID